MIHRNKSNYLFELVLLVLCLSTMVASDAQANGQTIRPMVFRILESAQTKIDEKDYAGAKEELEKLSKMNRNSYEKAMTFNIYAYLYFSQEDYNSAIKSYENVLALSIPESLQQTTLYSLAKLSLATENYSKSIEYLRKWQKIAKKPNAESHIMLGQSYLQLKDDQLALNEIKKGMQIARNEGLIIKENWYLLERSVYYKQGDYQGLEKNLKELVAFYPKTQYWLQLSAVYDELNQVGRSLAVLETAYDKGFLKKESELISFASLLLQVEIPYKAGKVLEAGIHDKTIEKNTKHLALLADAWMLAKEYDKAIAILEESVAISDTGEQAFKLAQVYMEKNEWEKSGQFISKAIEQGHLKDEGTAYLMQGLIYFNQQKLENAVQAFYKAKKYEKQSQAAEQWLNYVEQEKARLEYISSFG